VEENVTLLTHFPLISWLTTHKAVALHKFSVFLAVFNPIIQGANGASTVQLPVDQITMLDYVFVAFHVDLHFFIGVVDFKQKTVFCYDSLGTNRAEYARSLLMVVKEMYRNLD
jgi:Ulp1 family protease